MKNKLISFILLLCLLIAIPLSARYKYNPFTRKLDYYEPVSGSDLGDLGDVTLTGLATGNVLYYNGTAWVNLATGANTNVLMLAGGVPTWATIDTLGAVQFTGDVEFLEDIDVTWADALDHMVITQSSEAGTEDQALILITDDREDATTDEPSESTLVIAPGGNNAFYVAAGDSTFGGDLVANDDVLFTWGSASNKMVITQGSESGTEDQPLIRIDDAREGATVDETGEASLYIAGEGWGLVTIGKSYFEGNFEINNVFSYDYSTDHNLLLGYLAGQDLTAGQGQYNTLLGEEAGADVTTGDYNIIIGYMTGRKITTNVSNILIGRNIASVSTSQAHSNVIIGDTAAIELTNGYENIIIGKEAARDIKSAGLNVIIGWQASLEHESGNNNVVIGSQAGVGVAGSSNYGFNTIVGANAGEYVLTAGVRNVVIGYQAAQELSSGTDNIVIGYMAGEGWLDTESEKLVIDVTDTTDPLIYGDFSADNITINGDFTVEMDAALDRIVFHQGSEGGTEDQSLIFIDDAREGATVDEWSEASLYIAGEGWGLAVIGKTYFEGDSEINGDTYINGELLQGDYIVSQVVNYNDEGPIAVCNVADGYVVTDVWVEITTVWNGNGTIEIGDGNDANGFLDDAIITQTGLGYYGSDMHLRGAYLDDGKQKIYTGGDTVDATLVQGTSSQGIATVYVHITRLK